MAKDGGQLLSQKGSGETTTVNTVISSFEEEEDIKNVNFINAMDFKSYALLRKYFFNSSLLLVGGSLRNKYPEKIVPNEALHRADFIVAVEKLDGKFGIAASRFFDEVDDSKRGYITWQEFLDHSLQLMNKPETTRQELNIPDNIEYHGIKHFTETDCIIKIIPLTVGSEQRFDIVSMRGHVSRYNEEFKVLPKSGYSVPVWGRAASQPPQLHSSKIAQPWITDVVYMDDIDVIIFAASDRSLHFRDAGTGRGAPWMFHISRLRSIPTCLAYMSPERNESEREG